MPVLGGLKPSELDAATISALQTALGLDAGTELAYGQGLMNIRRKLKTMIGTFGKPASSIRIAVFADSIFASSDLKADIVAFFNTTWGVPTANVDVNCCWGAYMVDQYSACLDGVAIGPNVDLVILNEMGGTEIMWNMIAKIRDKTNADIMIGSWSVHADLNPIPRYQDLIDMAKYFHCEILDINGILLNKNADGVLSPLLTSPTGVHLSTAGAALIYADFQKHFSSSRYYNEYVNEGELKEDIIFPGAGIKFQINSNIVLSGSWLADYYGTVAYSSSIGDYIEIVFNGIGFETLFNSNVAENIHNILVDGAAPSAYTSGGKFLEYCTQIIGKTQANVTWYFHRLFAAYVTAPFMTNAETEVEFEITIDSITRDGGGLLTGMGYTLKQGATTLGTGNINTDSTFTFRSTGEITIPALVYGFPNFWEVAGYPFTVGDTMSFYARKTWKDSIDTHTETFARISGLARGSHTLRITKATALQTVVRYLSIYK